MTNQYIGRSNHILTSPFDIHETLLDIIKWDFEDISQQLPNRTRGQSLFRPISSMRTCDQAGIPEEFCVCLQETFANVTDENVIRAANILISHVNSLLKNYRNCAILTLNEVRNAQLILPNIKTVMDPSISFLYGGRNPSGFFINYRIMISANPSDAILEATLKHSVKDDSFVVVGDVNRINRYGNQSICVNKPLLRKYCYCLDHDE